MLKPYELAISDAALTDLSSRLQAVRLPPPAGNMRWMKETARKWLGSSETPAAFALFPKDISTPPRKWAERFFNVQRWTEMPKGGHFAALEEPELLAKDIRDFFRPLRRVAPAAGGAPRRLHRR